MLKFAAARAEEGRALKTQVQKTKEINKQLRKEQQENAEVIGEQKTQQQNNVKLIGEQGRHIQQLRKRIEELKQEDTAVIQAQDNVLQLQRQVNLLQEQIKDAGALHEKELQTKKDDLTSFMQKESEKVTQMEKASQTMQATHAREIEELLAKHGEVEKELRAQLQAATQGVQEAQRRIVEQQRTLRQQEEKHKRFSEMEGAIKHHETILGNIRAQNEQLSQNLQEAKRQLGSLKQTHQKAMDAKRDNHLGDLETIRKNHARKLKSAKEAHAKAAKEWEEAKAEIQAEHDEATAALVKEHDARVEQLTDQLKQKQAELERAEETAKNLTEAAAQQREQVQKAVALATVEASTKGAEKAAAARVEAAAAAEARVEAVKAAAAAAAAAEVDAAKKRAAAEVAALKAEVAAAADRVAAAEQKAEEATAIIETVEDRAKYEVDAAKKRADEAEDRAEEAEKRMKTRGANQMQIPDGLGEWTLKSEDWEELKILEEQVKKEWETTDKVKGADFINELGPYTMKGLLAQLKRLKLQQLSHITIMLRFKPQQYTRLFSRQTYKPYFDGKKIICKRYRKVKDLNETAIDTAEKAYRDAVAYTQTGICIHQNTKCDNTHEFWGGEDPIALFDKWSKVKYPRKDLKAKINLYAKQLKKYETAFQKFQPDKLLQDGLRYAKQVNGAEAAINKHLHYDFSRPSKRREFEDKYNKWFYTQLKNVDFDELKHNADTKNQITPIALCFKYYRAKAARHYVLAYRATQIRAEPTDQSTETTPGLLPYLLYSVYMNEAGTKENAWADKKWNLNQKLYNQMQDIINRAFVDPNPARIQLIALGGSGAGKSFSLLGTSALADAPKVFGQITVKEFGLKPGPFLPKELIKEWWETGTSSLYFRQSQPVETDLTEIAQDWIQYKNNHFDQEFAKVEKFFAGQCCTNVKRDDGGTTSNKNTAPFNVLIELHLRNCQRFKKFMRWHYARVRGNPNDLDTHLYPGDRKFNKDGIIKDMLEPSNVWGKPPKMGKASFSSEKTIDEKLRECASRWQDACDFIRQNDYTKMDTWIRANQYSKEYVLFEGPERPPEDFELSDVTLKTVQRMLARGFYYDNRSVARQNIFRGDGDYVFDRNDFLGEFAQSYRILKAREQDANKVKSAGKAAEGDAEAKAESTNNEVTPTVLDIFNACNELRSTRCTPLNPSSSRSFLVVRFGTTKEFTFMDPMGKEKFNEKNWFDTPGENSDETQKRRFQKITKIKDENTFEERLESNKAFQKRWEAFKKEGKEKGILYLEQRIVSTQLKEMRRKLDADADSMKPDADSVKPAASPQQTKPSSEGIASMLHSAKDYPLFTILLAHIRGVTLDEDISNIDSILAADMDTLEILTHPKYEKLTKTNAKPKPFTPPSGCGNGYAIENETVTTFLEFSAEAKEDRLEHAFKHAFLPAEGEEKNSDETQLKEGLENWDWQEEYQGYLVSELGLNEHKGEKEWNGIPTEAEQVGGKWALIEDAAVKYRCIPVALTNLDGIIV